MSHQLNDTNIPGFQIFLESKYSIQKNEGSQAFFFFNQVLNSRQDMDLLIGVVDCEIPMSMYSINASNNTLKVNNVVYTITEAGNYDAFNIQDTLNTLFIPINTTVDFNKKTNKFKITNNGFGGTVELQGGTLLPFLGFTEAQLDTPLNAITAENCCNLAGIPNLYINSNFNISNIDSSGNYNGCLAKISTTASAGSYVMYQPNPIHYHLVSNGNISNIVIDIVDDQKQYIDFNGLTWSMTLSCHFRKKRTVDISTLSGTDFYLQPRARALQIQDPPQEPPQEPPQSEPEIK
tara:strand:- start:1443 stop:2318 length:876 start_codon:yes stop_codon:yes gene_type:complete